MKQFSQRGFNLAKKNMMAILDRTSCTAAKEAILAFKDKITKLESYRDEGLRNVVIGNITRREFDSFDEAYTKWLMSDIDVICDIFICTPKSTLEEKLMDYKRVVAAKKVLEELI